MRSGPALNQSLERLQGWVIPEDIKRLLFAHYEKQGNYAKVEDVLFHYMEDHPDRSVTLEQGVIFYEKLLDMEEERLQAGNFSKEEAFDGLAYCEAKAAIIWIVLTFIIRYEIEGVKKWLGIRKVLGMII